MQLNYTILCFLKINIIVIIGLTNLPSFAQTIDDYSSQKEDFSISPQEINAICKMDFNSLPVSIPKEQIREICKNFLNSNPGANNPKEPMDNVDGFLNLPFLGDSANSLAAYEQALKNAQKSGNKVLEAKTLIKIGDLYTDKFQYYQALPYYEQSLEIAKNLNDRQLQIDALQNIGGLYAVRKQYEEASKCYQQLLAIINNSSSKETYLKKIYVLSTLGLLYQYQGDKNKAQEMVVKVLEIPEHEIDDKSNFVLYLRRAGKFYESLGDYNTAKKIYENIKNIAKKETEKEEAVLMEVMANKSLAGLYETQKKYPQALELHQKSLSLLTNSNYHDVFKSGIFTAIGRIYNYLNRYNEAENILGNATKLGDSFLLNTLNSIDENNLLPTVGIDSNLMNKIAWNISSQLDEVIPYVYEMQKNSYQELQKSLIAQNKNNSALEIAENSRARAFSQIISARMDMSSKRIAIPKAKNLNITEIQDIAKKQNVTLVQYSIIKNNAQEGDSIFEYDVKIPQPKSQDDLQLLIWVIKPSGEIAFRQVDLKSVNNSLETLVKNSRNTIVRANASKKATESSLQQLHQLLINPIAEYLPTNPNDRVIFIPDGALFLVPFVALQDAQGKYLIEKHTISTSPAIKILELVNQQRQKVSGKGALVVGNPKMPDYASKLGEKARQLSALPNAELEAQAIAKFLNTKAVIGEDATKQVIVQQMPNARIIHFATHGLLDDYEGLGSAIALAPSGKDDGFLTAQELVQMKLNAELVVLSACDTGRGVITGDGVIGLSRSFFAAGVPSVVVSLWAVPDAPTSILMTEFYQSLQTQPNKAQALRQAMLNTMKKHPAPQNWAAFTLVGEAF